MEQAGSNLELCPWMEPAFREEGVRERKGADHNTRILEYIATCDRGTRSWVARDETSWCSAFVNWSMRQAGFEGTNDLRARSWLFWGEEVPLTQARIGDVVVFWRGVKLPKTVLNAPGHVAFYDAQHGARLRAFGGNQGNAVRWAYYPERRVLSVRRPAREQLELMKLMRER